MLSLILALAATAAPAPADDPLAPARAGKVQCIAPKTDTKKCMAIASFTMKSGDAYDAVVTTMIAPTPLIVMETRTSGTVENGQVCGVVRKEEYAASTFKMDGTAMDPAMAEGVKGELLAAVGPMDGKKACSTDKPEGDVIVSTVTLDGTPHPELTQRFIWVDPAEYSVGQ